MPLAKPSTPFFWTAYILWPAAGWGAFHGAPAGTAGLAALFAIWWIWLSGHRLPGRRALAVLVVLKLLSGALLLVDRGMEATYFANAEWAGPPEQSTDFPGRRFTRIDSRLAFGGVGDADIPLYFFNDSSRFNFYLPTDPDRATLPFSAAWQGYAWSRGTETSRTFYVRGRDVQAVLWVDDVEAVRLQPSAQEALGKAPWSTGTRHLVVRVSSRTGGRQFEAGVVGANGTRTPFSDADLVARSTPPWRLGLDRVVRILSLAIDAVLIVLLAGAAGMTLARTWRQLLTRERRGAIVRLCWAATFAAAVYSSRTAAHHLILLGGGQDYLAYETYARDIALHGPLMLQGHAMGAAQPFYYQPLYPYVLAVVHLLAGEDLSGIYVVQWLLASGVVLMVWRIAARLFGVAAGCAALGLAGVFFVAKLLPLSRVLLNENVFIPLLLGWALAMIQMAAPESTTRAAVRAGVIGGLATLARSTLLAGWMLALPVLAWSMRRSRTMAASMAILLIAMVAVVSLATARNAIATHRFVAVTSSFGVNLYMGNQPPAGVTIIPGSDYNSMVLQFARNAPGLFVRHLVAKALYALGYFEPLVPGAGIAPGLMATWLAALIGIGIVMRDEVPDGLRGPIRALLAAIALGQLLIVIVFFPHVYGDRLILPFYVLLLPYAALGTLRTLDFLVPPDKVPSAARAA